MTSSIYYQWPSPPYLKNVKKDKLDKKLFTKYHNDKLKNIERFFSKKFKVESKLFPSGRACIGIILKYLKLNILKKTDFV